MFVHRGPTASSGLGPGRPHELRVDYQIADQEGICPREPLRQREGSPGAHAQAKEGPRGHVCWLFCVSLMSFPSTCHCGDGSAASPRRLRDPWLLLGEYWFF